LSASSELIAEIRHSSVETGSLRDGTITESNPTSYRTFSRRTELSLNSRIPTQSGRGFRFDPGRLPDLKPAA
jgi:hypothetical protein